LPAATGPAIGWKFVWRAYFMRTGLDPASTAEQAWLENVMAPFAIRLPWANRLGPAGGSIASGYFDAVLVSMLTT
jgi:hypothetical protein